MGNPVYTSVYLYFFICLLFINSYNSRLHVHTLDYRF
jgi:hypothetical protein